jgi:BirA family biotin operon repressor/biotin-[acetyl-CoA-carboxylase] ligase
MSTFGDLSVELVREALKTSRYGRSLELKESTASTNDDARAAASAGAPDGHVVLADTQTRGRGAHGRTWVSPPGKDLYLSIVAHVPVALEHLPCLTLAVGLGVADTVDPYFPPGLRAQVKWPNDVWLDRKKCAGILVEGASQGERALPVVIGIGLNVNRHEFPEGLDAPPASLAMFVGETPRVEVLADLLLNVETWVDRFVSLGAGPVVESLNTRLALHGEPVHCDDVTGVVEAVQPSGALLLRTESGPREMFAGTLRPLRRDERDSNLLA